MAIPIDAGQYTTIPRLNQISGVNLARMLIAQAPAQPTEAMKLRLDLLREDVAPLAREVADRRDAPAAGPTVEATRATDNRLDCAWGGLYRRLDGLAQLPAERVPEAARAQSLQNRLFGNGLSFVLLPYPQEWAHSQALLDLIAEEKLEPELTELAGKQFLPEIRAAHEAYRPMVESKQAKEARANLVEALHKLSADIADYALQVLASVDPRKPETVQAARAALKPIDDFRAANAKPRKPEKPNP